MKWLFVIPILILILPASGQKQEITVTMQDGSTRQMEYRLSRYRGEPVIVNDIIRKIKGRKEGERIKLAKEDIAMVQLETGQRYHLQYRNNWPVFGQRLAYGELEIYKMFFWTDSEFDEDLMDVTPFYYKKTNGELDRIRPRRFLREVAETCPALRAYEKKHGKVNRREFDVFLSRINEMCR